MSTTTLQFAKIISLDKDLPSEAIVSNECEVQESAVLV